MTDEIVEPEELLSSLRSGDKDALAELFALHRDRLRRMVRFRLHPKLVRRIDPDDVLQEAWLAALQRIDSYRDQEDPSCYLWLRLIVGQTMVDLHRRHIGAKMRDANMEVPMSRFAGPQAQSHTVSMHLSGGLPTPSEAAVRNEAGAALEQVLQDMDDIDREVLVLRHIEELSNAEVAKVLEIQPSAASNRYVRALERLKGMISGRPELDG